MIKSSVHIGNWVPAIILLPLDSKLPFGHCTVRVFFDEKIDCLKHLCLWITAHAVIISIGHFRVPSVSKRG